MSKTILLAVDTAHRDLDEHVSAAVEMIKDLVHADDRVVVLHVHEFAIGRFGRIQVDCAEGQGEQLVSDIVARLGSAGVKAEGSIREADYGHVARRIVAEAENAGARMLVLGSSSRTDLPRVPFGSVSSRLLHIASLPVMIVPMHKTEKAPAQTGVSVEVDAGTPAQDAALAD
ncbi:MAG TPA: universal stress protein [Streptosporangiaceae bacterium]|nr:universal stress protein [Streptosporangiaceae bacterium]